MDAHRDLYAAAVAIQAAVMAKAARALIALHEGLHDDVRQDAGNDYGKWHPVGFGGDGLGNDPPLDAVVALCARIAATPSRRGVVLLPISIEGLHAWIQTVGVSFDETKRMKPAYREISNGRVQHKR